jgi:hypothetical protein
MNDEMVTIPADVMVAWLEEDVAYRQATRALVASLKQQIADRRDSWVNTSAAAAFLELDPSQVRYLARSGQLSSRKNGPMLVEISLNDCRRYKAEMEQKRTNRWGDLTL